MIHVIGNQCSQFYFVAGNSWGSKKQCSKSMIRVSLKAIPFIACQTVTHHANVNSIVLMTEDSDTCETIEIIYTILQIVSCIVVKLPKLTVSSI